MTLTATVGLTDLSSFRLEAHWDMRNRDNRQQTTEDNKRLAEKERKTNNKPAIYPGFNIRRPPQAIGYIEWG